MNHTRMGFEDEIQSLFRAGLATHFVAQDTAVDPLYALAKARDFPEVTFAAAFDDGVVILGCAGGVPEPLRALAIPITPRSEPADLTLTDTLIDKFDELSAEIRNGQRNTRVDLVLDKLDDLADQIKLQPAPIANLTARVADISERFSERYPATHENSNDADELVLVNDQLKKLLDRTDPEPAIAEMIGNTSASFSAIEATLAAHPETGLLDQFTVLEAKLIAQIRAASDLADLSAQNQNIATTQQQMHTIIAHMANDLAAFCAQDGSRDHLTQDINFELLSDKLELILSQQVAAKPIQEKLEQMDARLERIQARDITKSDAIQRKNLAQSQLVMANVMSRLEQCIDQLTAHGSNTELIGTTPVGQIDKKLTLLEKLPEQLGKIDALLQPLPDTHAALSEALQTLNNRSDPVVDFSEQRRSLSSFSNTLHAMVKRIEASAQVAISPPTDLDLSTIEAKLNSVLALGKNWSERVNLSDQLGMQKEAFDSFAIVLNDVADRPAPVLDLTQQRASFAQFGAALSVALNRIGVVADQLESTTFRCSQRTDQGEQQADDPGQFFSGSDKPATEVSDMDADKAQPEVSLPRQITSSFVEETVEMQSMRYSFAELLASQFKLNACATVNT